MGIQMNLTNYLFKVISVSAQWDKMCSESGATSIQCTDIVLPSASPGTETPDIGCCGWVEKPDGEGEGECKYQSAGHCSCNGKKDCGQGCEWRPWTTTTTTSAASTTTTKQSRRLVKDDPPDDDEENGFCVESGSSASGIFRLGFIAALVALM